MRSAPRGFSHPNRAGGGANLRFHRRQTRPERGRRCSGAHSESSACDSEACALNPSPSSFQQPSHDWVTTQAVSSSSKRRVQLPRPPGLQQQWRPALHCTLEPESRDPAPAPPPPSSSGWDESISWGLSLPSSRMGICLKGYKLYLFFFLASPRGR